jgi:hypothetical protein
MAYYAIVDSQGVFAGAYSETNNPPRPLQAGESVVETDDPATLPQPALKPPESVTPAQIRLWLIANYGPTILAQIDGMLAAIPDLTQREAARVRWDYGLVVLRGDPLIVQFGLALGLSELQINQAFVDASLIE